MNIRSLLSALVLTASFGVAAASAADAGRVTPAKFGRDGVPGVTVPNTASGPADCVQPFGRDVPKTRVVAARPRPAVQSHTAPDTRRFGRA